MEAISRECVADKRKRGNMEEEATGITLACTEVARLGHSVCMLCHPSDLRKGSNPLLCVRVEKLNSLVSWENKSTLFFML